MIFSLIKTFASATKPYRCHPLALEAVNILSGQKILLHISQPFILRSVYESIQQLLAESETKMDRLSHMAVLNTGLFIVLLGLMNCKMRELALLKNIRHPRKL